MKNTLLKTGIIGTMVALSFLAASVAGAQESDAVKVGTSQEVHITNGKTLVRGAKVTAVSSSGFTATNMWGTSSVTWNVMTGSGTPFVRRYGGASSLSEISVNDIVSFSGNLNQSGAAFSVNADTVKDWSVQKMNATISGTVSSISGQTFVLHTPNRGDVTVSLAASSTIMKAGSSIAFSVIAVNDRISSATGVLDSVNHTLVASKIVIYVNQSLLNRRTFEGKLKSVAATTLPTSIIVTVGSTDYTVNVPANISILNKNWLATTLGTFKIGDDIRFYGAAEAGNTSVVDATIVRDTSI